MDIIIYENKQGKTTSIRATNKHITEVKNFYKHYGTVKTRYTITQEEAFKECKKFYLNQLSTIGQRVDIQRDIQGGFLTWEEFCNDNLATEVF